MDEEQDNFRNALQAHRSAVEILSSNFHEAEPSWLAEASFALLMINLKDLCQTLARYNLRISFSEDVPGGRDVTDLIRDTRNAVCHIGSPLRHIGATGTVSFGRILGKGILISTPEFQMANPYEDDCAFFYGRHMVLLKRHAHRVAKEADQKLQARFASAGWWSPYGQ